MRCFIALPLPEDARKALAAWTGAYRSSLEASVKALSAAHRPHVSWVRSEGYHLTLAFLGEIEEKAAQAATESLDSLVGTGAFAFGLYAPEGFPHRGPWRVLFARLEDRGRSALAYRAINEALSAIAEAAQLGKLNPEWPSARPFSPHVTIARVSGRAALEAARAESAALGLRTEAAPGVSDPGLAGGAWTIGRCALYKSELRSGGAVYTELRSVNL
jgi:RNA 2',3'-cyclic 3'-phosphodiesterase